MTTDIVSAVTTNQLINWIQKNNFFLILFSSLPTK